MKFNVRTGFVVAYTDRIKQGDKTVERAYAFYPEDGPIDLDKAHALDHAHKLEAADKEAKALLDSLVLPAAPAVAAGGIDVQAMATALVQAMVIAQGQMAGGYQQQAKGPSA